MQHTNPRRTNHHEQTKDEPDVKNASLCSRKAKKKSKAPENSRQSPARFRAQQNKKKRHPKEKERLDSKSASPPWGEEGATSAYQCQNPRSLYHSALSTASKN